ncbi:MAG: Uma2 family endonuclease [Lewinellaceae bacterium]|nr:Uma2 family endonuclease [Lewinellaceae bacterium]
MLYTEELVETAANTYEIEREKPMPSKHHAIIQGNINFLIRLIYGDKFRVLSEISIKFPLRDRIPDLAIYRPMEYGEEEIKMSEIPLGVVEILSPTQSHEELEIKRKVFRHRRAILLAGAARPEIRVCISQPERLRSVLPHRNAERQGFGH